ncbi:MAG: hypothetical protein BAA02_13855 [Paenibacillaceae bacterium ZCTH02-B3]|nr:MAG: hypothetical protein BAA02_13855 [Paenibacillaceae bacterium ZCTH02-B3]
MNRRKVPAFTVLMAVILALMLIGVIRQATTNPAALILPLAVIGALLLMIKYPPSRWSRAFRRKRSPVGAQRRHPSSSKAARMSKTKGKVIPFRVIEGKKGRQNEPPNVH